MIHDWELDQTPPSFDPRPRGWRWRISVPGLMKLVFAVACASVVLRLLLPSVTYCDCEAARRAQCFNNLKQIQLALQDYHQLYGVFPPAYVADASGRPMHSWRVLILPLLDRADLYGQYDFAEPWDGPHNIKLLDRMPVVYACPSRPPGPTSITSYLAIGGPGTMFPGTEPVRIADVTDGLENTLVMAEVSNLAIPWTAPVDLDGRTMSLRVKDPARQGISSQHPYGAATAFGDGRVYFWEDVTPVPRALLTIAGGDAPGKDAGLRWSR